MALLASLFVCQVHDVVKRMRTRFGRRGVVSSSLAAPTKLNPNEDPAMSWVFVFVCGLPIAWISEFLVETEENFRSASRFGSAFDELRNYPGSGRWMISRSRHPVGERFSSEDGRLE